MNFHAPTSTAIHRYLPRTAAVLLCATALTASLCWAQDASTPPATAPAVVAAVDESLQRASAERLALIADSLVSDDASDAGALQAIGYYDLARRAAPNELRFQRAYVDHCMRLGRIDDALKGLSAIRKIDPTNELAQVQTFDLSLERIESADKKVEYLNQVIAASTVSADVRSHAAVQAYALYIERGDDAAAAAMLDKALALDPQNIEALNLRLTAMINSGQADFVKQAEALQNVLRASPFDARALVTLAQHCVAAGAYQEASLLYLSGINISQYQGMKPSMKDVEAHLGAMAGMNSPKMLQAAAEAYGAVAQDDARVNTFKLIGYALTKPSPDELKVSAQAARGVWLARIAGLSAQLNAPPVPAGSKPPELPRPSTQPDQPLPPIDADVAKLRAANAPEFSQAYAEALVDLVVYDALAARQTSPEQITKAIANLTGEQSPAYALAEGLRLLSAGDREAARAKLGAVAHETDRAVLGLIIADVADGKLDKAKEGMTELLKRRPAGLDAGYVQLINAEVGAAAPELDADDKRVQQIGKEAYAYVAIAAQRPRDLYIMTVDPVKGVFDFDEPMLANVTIRALSTGPIVFGGSGLIDGTVVIDAFTSARDIGMLSAISAAKLQGPIKLSPGETYTQTIRIDGPRLQPLLSQLATSSIPLRVTATSNGRPGKTGAFMMPGGMQTQVGRSIERRAAPLQQPAYRARMLRELAEGDGVMRTNRFDLLATVAQGLRGNASSPEVQGFIDEIDRALTDALIREKDPTARTWMMVSRASTMSDPAELRKVADGLMAVGTPLDRAAALLMAHRLSKAEQAELIAAATVGDDVPPAIRDIAEGLRQAPERPATQPADTTPATKP
ncbi:MAG: hypothetical protein QM770_16275 [Tepidisphaeraceae bacterium]